MADFPVVDALSVAVDAKLAQLAAEGDRIAAAVAVAVADKDAQIADLTAQVQAQTDKLNAK